MPLTDAAPVTKPDKLIDPYGRTVDYLRVSVTDRCDFRCVYCMAVGHAIDTAEIAAIGLSLIHI